MRGKGVCSYILTLRDVGMRPYGPEAGSRPEVERWIRVVPVHLGKR
jgi:hypothetical protein